MKVFEACFQWYIYFLIYFHLSHLTGFIVDVLDKTCKSIFRMLSWYYAWNSSRWKRSYWQSVMLVKFWIRESSNRQFIASNVENLSGVNGYVSWKTYDHSESSCSTQPWSCHLYICLRASISPKCGQASMEPLPKRVGWIWNPLPLKGYAYARLTSILWPVMTAIWVKSSLRYRHWSSERPILLIEAVSGRNRFRTQIWKRDVKM